MIKFTDTIRHATTVFFTQAEKMPENLVLDVETEHGNFTVSFILQLKEDQLCDLRKEALKKDEDFFLMFYSVSEEDFSNGKAPFKVKDFSKFDFSKVVDIKFNGDTINLQPKLDADPIPYVSVTLVLKD